MFTIFRPSIVFNESLNLSYQDVSKILNSVKALLQTEFVFLLHKKKTDGMNLKGNFKKTKQMKENYTFSQTA